MITVIIQGYQAEGPPVVTTPETIDEQRLSKVMAPVVAGMMDAVEKITGVYPVQMTLAIYWADGTEPPKKEPTPKDPPLTNIPKWMS